MQSSNSTILPEFLLIPVTFLFLLKVQELSGGFAKSGAILRFLGGHFNFVKMS